MGVKSFGPVTRAPGRVAELPPGSDTLTDATLAADSATAVVADASPICARSGAAHSASAVRIPRRLIMPEPTAKNGRSPSRAATGRAPQTDRSGRDVTS